METTRLKSLLETLIFVAEEPLKTSEMLKAIQSVDSEQEARQEKNECEETESNLQENNEVAQQLETAAEAAEAQISKSEINQALKFLAQEYKDNPERGITLIEVAGGWQFRTKSENAAIIRQAYQPKPTKFSKPGLETLSIVAYRQPITRVEVDQIRGVDSGGVLRTLLEKNLIRIVGKKDEPGKPMLYGTTSEFLELFQLKALKELPSLKDFRDLEAEFNKKQGETGTVTENEADTENQAEKETSILALSAESQNELTMLDEEEEALLEDLEGNIKEVRGLEKEIFKPESESQEG